MSCSLVGSHFCWELLARLAHGSCGYGTGARNVKNEWAQLGRMPQKSSVGLRLSLRQRYFDAPHRHTMPAHNRLQRTVRCAARR